MRSLGQFQTFLFYFIFFYEKILHSQKSTKKHKKAQKAQNAKQATFFLLDNFYAHKNAAFFVFVRLGNFKLLCFFIRKFYTQKKHKKHTKSTKTQTSEQATFFALDIF